MTESLESKTEINNLSTKEGLKAVAWTLFSPFAGAGYLAGIATQLRKAPEKRKELSKHLAIGAYIASSIIGIPFLHTSTSSEKKTDIQPGVEYVVNKSETSSHIQSQYNFIDKGMYLGAVLNAVFINSSKSLIDNALHENTKKENHEVHVTTKYTDNQVLECAYRLPAFSSEPAYNSDNLAEVKINGSPLKSIDPKDRRGLELHIDILDTCNEKLDEASSKLDEYIKLYHL